MRVIHVITGLSKAAGTNVFCAEVCNGLVAAGHEVTIAVCDPTAKDCCPLDVRIKLTSISSILTTNHQQLATNFYDLVHIHAIWSPILHKVSKWARRNNLPVVWSPHGMLAPWAMRHKWWKKCLPWHLYQKGDLRRAALLHATSEQEELWIRECGFNQPVVVVPLGTAVESLKPVEDKASRTLLFVGRIYPVKALDRLIEAFSRVPLEVREGWKLRLVGPDQAGHMSSLKLIVKSLKLDDSVEFAGPKFGEELEREYDACDCLALVSYTENFGATVVDAMAHGKPVVTSDKTPWREVVEHKCGWWVSNEPERLSVALCEMMSLSDAERRQMGANGRHLVEAKYTWDAVVKEMVKGYLVVSG